jgi:hypothetical protein
MIFAKKKTKRRAAKLEINTLLPGYLNLAVGA